MLEKRSSGMAKLAIQTTRTLTLGLTEEEAKWLREVMQNPLHGEVPCAEDTEHATMRHSIFEALKEDTDG